MINRIAFNSDQAVVGLMANAAMHGHFDAFYWGQAYGGVESYIVAAMFAVGGSSALSLTLTPVILTGIASLLTWRVACHLVDDKWLAGCAGAIVWTTPLLGSTNTIEYGFRNVAMVAGVLSLLLVLRAVDGRRGRLSFVALGAVVGIGWWASPEFAFFLIPLLWILVGGVHRTWNSVGARGWVVRIALMLIAAMIGAMPWIWANLTNGF